MSAEEGPDLQSLSREELIALCEDLSAQFESAFRIVDQLEQENEGKDENQAPLQRQQQSRTTRRDGSDLDTLAQEHDELRKRLDDVQAQCRQLKDANVDLKAQVDVAEEEKRKAAETIAQLQKNVHDLKEQYQKERARASEAARRSVEVDKTRRSTQHEHGQLMEENRQLQEELDAKAKEIEGMLADQDQLVDALTALQATQEQTVAEKEDLELKVAELQQTVHELERQLREQVSQLVQAESKEQDLRQQIDTIRDAAQRERAEHRQAMAEQQHRYDELERELRALKDQTLFTEKENELEDLKELCAEQQAVIEQLHAERVQTAADMEQLAQRVQDQDADMEDQVYDAMSQVKKENKALELKLQNAKARLAEEEQKYQELERRVNSVQSRLDDALRWKEVYEQGNGLDELNREKERLLADLDRRERELAQMAVTLGEERDAKELLAQACQRLKRAAGIDANFEFAEHELREELRGEKARLEAQVREMDRQIDALEQERLRLLRDLRNNAADISEKGVKFVGLTPDQLMKVNEFACNLRDGKLELPKASSSDSSENRRLKQTVRTLEDKISALQAELALAPSSRPGHAPQSTAERDAVVAMREDLSRLLAENAELHNQLQEMHEQVLAVITETRTSRRTTAVVSQTPTAKDDAVPSAFVTKLLEQNQSLQRALLELKLERGREPPASPPRSAASKQQQAPSPVRAAEPEQFSPDKSVLFVSTSKAKGPTTSEQRQPAPPQQVIMPTARVTLPPEEWADEVQLLNTQLTDCLEQLQRRETELESQDGVIKVYEETLIQVKQQMAALYIEHDSKAKDAAEAIRKFKEENSQLVHRNEELKLRLGRLEQQVELMSKDDEGESQRHIRELTRKVTIYEVNEMNLSRRYTSLMEQLQAECREKQQLQVDLAELEGTLKARILFLEQHKLNADAHLAKLQQQLDDSVPAAEYECAVRELNSLRQDYLTALEREVEHHSESAVIAAQEDELQRLKTELAAKDIEIARLQATAKLQDENVSIDRILSSPIATGNEYMDMVRELAAHRGEASRLNIELAASQKCIEITSARVTELEKQLQAERSRMSELKKEKERAETEVSELNSELVALSNKFEGGLDRRAAQSLRDQLVAAELKQEELEHEIRRYKELAEIAASQAKTMQAFRAAEQQTITALREQVAMLESRTEDDAIIGRLQRETMTIKASYKAFTRKYEVVRSSLRQRELAVRMLEEQFQALTENTRVNSEKYRAQILVLKCALKEAQDTDLSTVTLRSANAARLSEQMKRVSDTLAKLSTNRSSSRQSAKGADCQVTELQDELNTVRAEVAALQQTIRTLKAGDNTETKLASQVITLSEELRAQKLGVLQSRRQIQVLREEKVHLESLVKQRDEHILQLETGVVDVETRALLASHTKESLAALDDLLAAINVADAPAVKLPQLVTPAAPTAAEANDTKAVLHENALPRLEAMNRKIADLMREVAELKIERDSLTARANELQHRLSDRERNIEYYEDMLTRHGLPTIAHALERQSRDASPFVPRNLMREDQDKLQEAATATISSLKLLLEEKERMLEKYRAKIEELQAVARPQTMADRRAEQLLHELQSESRPGSSKSHSMYRPDSALLVEERKRHLEKLEESAAVIAERDDTIKQLEQKLRAALNQKERAETRCGEALQEMEAMKSDILTLAQQLQDAEARYQQVLQNSDAKQKIAELQRTVSSKENKLRSLRKAVIRLKEEFVRAEERRAEENAMLRGSATFEPRAKPASSEIDGQIEEMKAKMDVLQAGLKQAKSDLEAAKTQREKLLQAKQLKEEEVAKLSKELELLRANQQSKEDTLFRTRRELEESKRLTVRLRAQLKEGGKGGKGTAADDGTLLELERANKLLAAQNQALRSALDGSNRGMASTQPRPSSSGKDEVEHKDLDDGQGDELLREQQQNMQRWETEKKLQRKLGALEKKLKERSEQLETSQGLLKQARDNLNRVQGEKDALQKRLNTLQAEQQQNARVTTDEVAALEEFRGRIFELEQENERLKRQVEIELPRQVQQWRKRSEDWRDRADELEEAVEAAERRLKERADGLDPLRASENQYIREERLRDEIAELRQLRRELEGTTLERDAAAVEMRFDLEARVLEVERLKRRLHEVQSALETLRATGDVVGMAVAGTTARAKRERDLEGVVESMRRVIEKLKAENERLRKNAVEGSKAADLERKARDAVRKAHTLEEEVASLKAKLAAQGDVSSKLSQKQLQLTNLRKQLKTKEEQFKHLQVLHQEHEDKAVQLAKELAEANERIRELEDATEVNGTALDSEVQTLRQKIREQQHKIRELQARELELQANQSMESDSGGRADLHALQAELQQALSRIHELETARPTEARSGGDYGELERRNLQLSNEMSRLKEENEKLNQELQAFDLDFFEEIEDLKYKYSEAVRRLQLYEGTVRF